MRRDEILFTGKFKTLTKAGYPVRLIIMPSSKNNSKGFAHLLLILAGLIFFGTASASVIKTTREFPQQNNQSVLGEDEEIKEEEKRIKEELKREEKKFREDEKKVEEIKREEGKKVKELGKEQEKALKIQKKQKSEIRRELSREFKLKTSSGSGKIETEIESEEGKIKTKIEDDGRVKFEIEKDKLKIKFENGKLKIEREHEGTGEADFDEEELDELEQEVEDELEDQGIDIATSSAGVLIRKNKIRAATKFPLSINPETGQLIVTTPVGQKVVTILPDQAVENMLSKSVLSDVDEEEGEDSVEIEERNNNLVYKVKGVKAHKFLGFIPLKTAITAFVSAQTGQLTAREQSLLAQFISRLSF